MRTAVLCGLIGLAGCSRPTEVPSPALAQGSPAPQPVTEPLRPSYVPQDNYNVREREFLRQVPPMYRKLRALPGVDAKLIFLEANRSALVRRFS